MNDTHASHSTSLLKRVPWLTIISVLVGIVILVHTLLQMHDLSYFVALNALFVLILVSVYNAISQPAARWPRGHYPLVINLSVFLLLFAFEALI